MPRLIVDADEPYYSRTSRKDFNSRTLPTFGTSGGYRQLRKHLFVHVAIRCGGGNRRRPGRQARVASRRGDVCANSGIEKRESGVTSAVAGANGCRRIPALLRRVDLQIHISEVGAASWARRDSKRSLVLPSAQSNTRTVRESRIRPTHFERVVAI